MLNKVLSIDTGDINTVLASKDYSFSNENLDMKKSCILSKYKALQVYLIKETEIGDALKQIKNVYKNEDMIFPVLMFENSILEQKSFENISNGHLYYTNVSVVIECAVRSFIMYVSYFNEGIKNAFRSFPSIKRSLVQLYFMIYFYFLRKYLYITLNRENEKQLIKSIVLYIAHALLGLSSESDISDFVKTLQSDILNIDTKDIIKSIPRALAVMKAQPTLTFPSLFNEFVDVDPKPSERMFTSSFVRVFGADLSKLFIPNLYAKFGEDQDVTLSYFITSWYNFLFTNALLNQKTIALIKRLAGYGLKELENTYSDIVFRGHFGRC